MHFSCFSVYKTMSEQYCSALSTTTLNFSYCTNDSSTLYRFPYCNVMCIFIWALFGTNTIQEVKGVFRKCLFSRILLCSSQLTMIIQSFWCLNTRWRPCSTKLIYCYTPHLMTDCTEGTHDNINNKNNPG